MTALWPRTFCLGAAGSERPGFSGNSEKGSTTGCLLAKTPSIFCLVQRVIGEPSSLSLAHTCLSCFCRTYFTHLEHKELCPISSNPELWFVDAGPLARRITENEQCPWCLVSPRCEQSPCSKQLKKCRGCGMVVKVCEDQHDVCPDQENSSCFVLLEFQPCVSWFSCQLNLGPPHVLFLHLRPVTIECKDLEHVVQLLFLSLPSTHADSSSCERPCSFDGRFLSCEWGRHH